MPGGGVIRFFKEKKDLYTKYKGLIGTLKMVTLARYRQALPRVQTRDYAMKFSRKAFDVQIGDTDEDVAKSGENEKILYVPITTNRGSCGALNASMFRYLDSLVGHNHNAKIVAVGKKGQDSLSKIMAENYDRAILHDMRAAQSFNYATYIVDHMKTLDWDRCVILFNRYVSASQQQLSTFVFPSFSTWVENVKKTSGAPTKDLPEGEPDNYQFMNALMEREGEFLRNYYDWQMAMSITHAVCDNELSEYAARIVAVENQLNNISGLLIQADYMYNKMRKELITAELLEIISTMSALTSGKGEVAKSEFWEEFGKLE